ncbi:MAG: efflux RND transporter permease subunit [Bacillota bacterium]|nr:efflux RND transporter permease subunit [Bacillota bacterium]
MSSFLRQVIRRPVFITVLVAVAVVLGAFSVVRLPNELIPDLNPPLVTVTTILPGASATEVRSLVSDPLQKAAATTPALSQMQVVSQESVSLMVLQFNWGSDVNRDIEELRTRIDQADLPSDARRPVIAKFDPAAMPVLEYVVRSEDGASLEKTTALIQDHVIPQLQGVDGVASVELAGDRPLQAQVELREADLARYGISPLQVQQAIRASNLNYPLGSVTQRDRSWNVRLADTLPDLDPLKQLVVGQRPAGVGPGGRPVVAPVRLQDVADVRMAAAEPTSYAYQDGEPTVALMVFKQSDANTVATADAVQKELDRLAAQNHLRFTKVLDSAEIVRSSIQDLIRDLVIGAVLAVLVIALFLRRARTALIAAISIPVSVITTFLVLYLQGMTLNLLTLGGLSLAVGLIVDDAIVVLEAIERHLERGKSPRQAAVEGTQEVAVAVVASTLAIVAVFLPIVFISGIAGVIFRQLAITVAGSVLVSLAVSLGVVPMVAAHLLRPGGGREGEGLLPRNRLTDGYRALLEWALDRRWAVLAGAAALLALSLLALPHLGSEFLPTTAQDQFQLVLEMPASSSLQAVDAKMREVEALVRRDGDVRQVVSQIGGSQGLAILGETTGGSQLAMLTVTVRDGVRPQTVIDRLRAPVDRVAPPATATFNLVSPMVQLLGAQASAIQVQVSAPDPALVDRWVPRIRDRLARLDGALRVSDSLSQSTPDILIRVDRAKAAAYGLTPAQVGMILDPALRGEKATQLQQGDQVYDIWVQLRPEDRNSPNRIADLRIPVAAPASASAGMASAGPAPAAAQAPQSVRLGDIATVEEGRGPVSIVRIDQHPAATVTLLFQNRDMGGMIADIDRALADLHLPADVNVQYTGVANLMLESFSGLSTVLVLAVILVFLIMAGEFESYLHPFVILLSLPLAAAGVLGALWTTGIHFSVTAFLGLILLVGIVVRNGIVMIDLIKQLREAGRGVREAIVLGAAVRARPVLMTALAAALGMVPVAFGLGGTGIKLLQPLGVVVIGGLFTATLLTLLVVPTVYSLLDPAYRKEQRAARQRPPIGDGLSPESLARLRQLLADPEVVRALESALHEARSQAPGGGRGAGA